MRKYILLLLSSTVFLSCETTSNTTDDSSGPAHTTEENTEGNNEKTSFVKSWETDTIFNTPESVLAYGEALYVSNVGGKNPLEKDGNGFISKLSTSGEVISLNWVAGLHAPKGMAILKGKLYVTDIDQLVEIDLESAEITNKYKVDESVFLNDVSAHKGSVYFSDMKTGKIHELKDETVTLFAEGLESVNGVYAEDNRLVCLNASGLQAIDYQTKSVSTLSEDVKGGDGIEKLSANSYVASKWKGQIFYVSDSKAESLLDTEKEGTQTADIGYLEKDKLVLVPTFFGNRVVAYRLDK